MQASPPQEQVGVGVNQELVPIICSVLCAVIVLVQLLSEEHSVQLSPFVA